MKVLSRSRWPLPPKVRTVEGGSNVPTIHRHVSAMWMFCESECVRCEVSRGSSWPPREGRARLRGAKPATKQPPCLMGPAQTDRWPATKDHSLHHSHLCLVAGLVALGWQPLENRGNLTPLQAADQAGPLASVLCQSFTVLVKTVKLQALALTLTPYEFHQQLIWNKTSSTQLLYCVEGHQKFMRLTLKKVKILFNLVLSVVNWPTNV